MRSRHLADQLVTVRKLIPQTGDEFGDASVEPHRAAAFSIKMQVMYNRRETSIAGAPGRDIGVIAMALVSKAECDAKGWVPEPDDLVELVNGDKLAVRDVQPDQAQPIRLGRPAGGWSEYRLNLMSTDPAYRAATTYE